MRARLAGLAVLVVVAVGGILWLRRSPKQQPPAPPKKVAARPQPAEKDTSLVLDATVEKTAGQRTIHLTTKNGGQATLVLEDAQSQYSEGFGTGRGRFEPIAEREKTAAFVTALGEWLDVTPPQPVRAGEPAALPISYVRLGTGDGWEASKLVFERGKIKDELYFNLSTDGKKARLLKWDADYGAGALPLLAKVVRDGFPPRRTPQSDPLVASLEPLYGLFQPVRGVNRLRGLVATEGGFLAAHEVKESSGRRISEVLLWEHPRELPRRVATSHGLFEGILPGPGGNLCVLAISYPRGESLSSHDPGELVVLNLADGSIAKLVDGDASGLGGAVAPDGRYVAVADLKVTTVYELATRKLVASTAPALDLEPLRWGADGLVLQHVELGTGKPTVTLYQWQPGQGEPQELKGPVPSPDGRFRLETTAEALAISGPGGSRKVAPTRPEDLEFLDPLHPEDGPRWLGPQHLLVSLEEPMALDLATGKLHYLFPAAGLKVQASSPDGRILIARDERGDSYWAERVK